jgi:hypothetical protein
MWELYGVIVKCELPHFFNLDDSCCDLAGIPNHVEELLQGQWGASWS